MIAYLQQLLILPVVLVFLSSLTTNRVVAGIPVPEEFYPLQKVDHFADDESKLWTQRYYTYGNHFQGPGHPIFLILGGEGGISPEAGIMYPFVADHLAKEFGGFVLQPEHRFYGKSQPLLGSKAATTNNTATDGTTTTRSRNLRKQGQEEEEKDPRVKLFTSEQALHDAMVLLNDVRANLGCSLNAGTDASTYCPVVTVGGSYPGFLAAFARMLFPDIVDMAYAASAPMGFYAQETERFAYYNHITAVAEDTLQGCSKAVKSALLDVRDWFAQSESVEDLVTLASKVGICEGGIPDYVLDDAKIISSNGDPAAGGFDATTMIDELMMVVGYTFANDNMASYPPGKDTRTYGACQIFASEDLSSTEKVQHFLTQRLHHGESRSTPVASSSRKDPACWNMTDQLPTGPNATISGGDWSGDGIGGNGESWDFQTCTLLVEAIGFSEGDSMFPARDWTLDWLREHCKNRFGVVPRPYELVRKYKFGSSDLASTNFTRILFTNGLKVSCY